MSLFDLLFGIIIGLGVYHYYYLSIDKTVHVTIPPVCVHLPDTYTTRETRQLRKSVEVLKKQRLNSVELDIGRWAYQYKHSDEQIEAAIEKQLVEYDDQLKTEVEGVL